MKKILCVLMVLVSVVFASCVGPTFGAEKDRFETVYNIDFLTKYVSLTDGVLHGDSVFQHSLILTDLESGIWGEIWHSASLFNLDNDSGDEIDIIVGYNNPFEDVDVSVSVAYYNLHSLLETSQDSFEFCGRVDYSKISNWNLFLSSGWLMPVDDLSTGSLSYKIGANYSLPKESWYSSSLEVSFGGREGNDPYVRLTDTVSLGKLYSDTHLSLNVQRNLGDGDTVFWAGIGTSFSL